MRWILFMGIVLALLVFSGGCIRQAGQPSAPVTPAGTGGSSVIIIPDTTVTVTPPQPRDINITAIETKTEVIIQYNGGNGASELTALNIRITNQDGQNIQRTIQSPVIGNAYVFTYHGNANAVVVNIVGTWKDGSQETVLMRYF
jgi:hypothetical protein